MSCKYLRRWHQSSQADLVTFSLYVNNKRRKTIQFCAFCSLTIVRLLGNITPLQTKKIVMRKENQKKVIIAETKLG